MIQFTNLSAQDLASQGMIDNSSQEKINILENKVVELESRLNKLQSLIMDVAAANERAKSKEFNAQTRVLEEEKSFKIAIEMIETGEKTEAINLLNEILIRFPDGEFAPQAYYLLGKLYNEGELLDFAKRALEHLVIAFPTHWRVPEALYELGEVYRSKADFQKALEYYNKIVQQYPRAEIASLASQVIELIDVAPPEHVDAFTP